MPRGCSDPIMWKRLPVTFRPRKFDVASDSRSGLDDVGPLDTLFGCPKSGLLFGVWEASLDVTASELVDARVFHCPVCDSTLKIGSPGKIPVARCVECDWTTAETGVVSIPDLLTSEVKPYRKANAEFSELRRLAAGLPSLGSELTATGKSELRAANDEAATGAQPLARDQAQPDLPVLATSCAHELPASSFIRTICMDSMLPRHEMLEAGLHFRANMAPHRKRSDPAFILRSPFSNGSVQPLSYSSCLRGAPTNASAFLPELTALCRFDLNEAVLSLSLRNVVDAIAMVSLEMCSPSNRNFESASGTSTWKEDFALPPFGSREASASCREGGFAVASAQRIEFLLELRFNATELHQPDVLLSSGISKHLWACMVCVDIPPVAMRV
jgi:hypothetical protein